MVTGKEHFGEIKQQQQNVLLLSRRIFFFFSGSGLEICAHRGATMGP